MSDLNNAWTIVENMMLANDSFSKMLGINIKELSLGACTLTMKVNESMTNGFSIGHGGITYSLADSALAFASNSHGRKAVSIETSISHLYPIFKDDELTAIATEENLSNRLGVYIVRVFNQNQKLVAHFKGTVFRKDENWL